MCSSTRADGNGASPRATPRRVRREAELPAVERERPLDIGDVEDDVVEPMTRISSLVCEPTLRHRGAPSAGINRKIPSRRPATTVPSTSATSAVAASDVRSATRSRR